MAVKRNTGEDCGQGSEKGRPSKYTPDVVKRILDALRDGNSHNGAAAAGGIVPSTFYEWMNAHPDFSEAVHHAERECELALVADLRKMAREDHRPLQFMLERRFPETWGRRQEQKIEITGANGGPVQVIDVRTLTDEQLAAYETLLAAGQIAPDAGAGTAGEATPEG